MSTHKWMKKYKKSTIGRPFPFTLYGKTMTLRKTRKLSWLEFHSSTSHVYKYAPLDQCLQVDVQLVDEPLGHVEDDGVDVGPAPLSVRLLHDRRVVQLQPTSEETKQKTNIKTHRRPGAWDPRQQDNETNNTPHTRGNQTHQQLNRLHGQTQRKHARARTNTHGSTKSGT